MNCYIIIFGNSHERCTDKQFFKTDLLLRRILSMYEYWLSWVRLYCRNNCPQRLLNTWNVLSPRSKFMLALYGVYFFVLQYAFIIGFIFVVVITFAPQFVIIRFLEFTVNLSSCISKSQQNFRNMFLSLLCVWLTVLCSMSIILCLFIH